MGWIVLVFDKVLPKISLCSKIWLKHTIGLESICYHYSSYIYIYIYINAWTLIELGKLGNDICHGRTNMDFSQLIEIYIYIYINFFFPKSDSLLSDLFICRAL